MYDNPFGAFCTAIVVSCPFGFLPLLRSLFLSFSFSPIYLLICDPYLEHALRIPECALRGWRTGRLYRDISAQARALESLCSSNKSRNYIRIQTGQGIPLTPVTPAGRTCRAHLLQSSHECHRLFLSGTHRHDATCT